LVPENYLAVLHPFGGGKSKASLVAPSRFPLAAEPESETGSVRTAPLHTGGHRFNPYRAHRHSQKSRRRGRNASWN